jgi:hypothetical protein
MAGEILSGCRQDRMVARDVLIAPKRRNLAVPVFCVEAGRWHFKSGAFGSEKNLGTHKLRAVAQSAAAPGSGGSERTGAGSGQSRIWAEVARANREVGVESETEALQDAYRDEAVARKVAEAEEQLLAAAQLGENTVGVVIAVGMQLVGVDLFASPHLFRRLWPKILKSSLMAQVGSVEQGRYTREQAAAVLTNLRQQEYAVRPALDLGVELSAGGSAGSLAASALAYRGVVLHLAGLPVADKDVSGLPAEEEAQELLPLRQQRSWR